MCGVGRARSTASRRAFKGGLKMRDVITLGMRTKLFVAALTLALAPASARAQVKSRTDDAARQTQAAEQTYAELPNFHAVNARLFRGGQPRSGGLRRLAALGVKTVINLRDDDARARDEEREARALGLRYFNVPLSRAHRPDARQIDELFALLDAAENQPVFVHCKRGADRTGALVAVSRAPQGGGPAGRAVKGANP